MQENKFRDEVADQLEALAKETMDRVIGIMSRNAPIHIDTDLGYARYRTVEPINFARVEQEAEFRTYTYPFGQMGAKVELTSQMIEGVLKERELNFPKTISSAMMFNLIAQLISQRNKMPETLIIRHWPTVEREHNFANDSIILKSYARIAGDFKNGSTTEIGL